MNRVDTFSKSERSRIMRQVRSRDTQPEKRVRSLLHRMGYRFRVNSAGLPGRPDIVLTKHRIAVFVHGCFWHRHRNCSRSSTPSSNQEYWLPKFERTMQRDRRNQKQLRKDGWKVLIIWECRTTSSDKLERYLRYRLS